MLKVSNYKRITFQFLFENGQGETERIDETFSAANDREKNRI